VAPWRPAGPYPKVSPAVGTAFDLIAMMYALFAVGVVVKLWRGGGATFDDHFTPTDRRLAGAATFYLLVPVAVALHELGHAVATWALGGHVADFHFMLYWGWVLPAREPAFLPWESAFTAAAGNLVTLAMGFGAILWTIRRPLNAAWNYVRLELARILLWLTLAIYPAFSLALSAFADGPVGDFAILREQLNATLAHAGDVTMGAYGLFALAVWRRWRGPWRERYLTLTSPLHDRLRAAQRRLDADPGDVPALMELGRAHLTERRLDGALANLERAAALAPDEPEVRYLAGMAQLAAGAPRDASEHLRAAGLELEAREGADSSDGPSELQFEVTLALAGTRLALRDAEGAVLTAEGARALRPTDPRALLVHADALVAAGRGTEARSKLEAALGRARGAFAHEIRRRLRSMAEDPGAAPWKG
jgi:tetratricopeptide (TPR) repeat protein